MKSLALAGLVLLLMKSRRAAAAADDGQDPPEDTPTGTWSGSPLEQWIPAEYTQPEIGEGPISQQWTWHVTPVDTTPTDPFGNPMMDDTWHLQPPTDAQLRASFGNAGNLARQLPGGIRQQVSNVQHLASFHRRLFHKVFG